MRSKASHDIFWTEPFTVVNVELEDVFFPFIKRVILPYIVQLYMYIKLYLYNLCRTPKSAVLSPVV